MKKLNLFTVLVVLLLASAFVFTSCGKAESTNTASAPAAKSDGSEDLTIDFRFNLDEADVENNYFTWTGNIRYMAAEKDQADLTTGASKLGSTSLFQSYLYDVEGKNTMSSGLRGLFLFAVNPYEQAVGDALNASKASDGTITIQYAHRGTAYRIVTDKKGELAFPNGTFESRAIGFIERGSPQVLSTDFAADGTAATIDWAKVWDSSVKSGKEIEGSTKKTGDIVFAGASDAAMYVFDGSLDVALEGGILTIKGFLTAVEQ